jgi:hypothetical protein
LTFRRARGFLPTVVPVLDPLEVLAVPRSRSLPDAAALADPELGLAAGVLEAAPSPWVLDVLPPLLNAWGGLDFAVLLDDAVRAPYGEPCGLRLRLVPVDQFDVGVALLVLSTNEVLLARLTVDFLPAPAVLAALAGALLDGVIEGF